MPDGATIRLMGDHTRAVACQLVQSAPEGWLVRIGEPPRTLDQSSRFWAACGEIAKTTYTWGGMRHDKQGWHDLLLSGWHVIKQHPMHLLLGIEGERVSLMKHSRDLSKTDMSDLLDYQAAWCAVRNITLKEDA
jgi:hypothetical protein